jgi:hypothetical protein
MHELAAFPALLRELTTAPPELLTKRSAAGFFALVENAWHLADLEVEGYGVRLRRLLDETNPSLPDFKGVVVARERDYLNLPLAPALDRFEHARAENVALIEGATEADRERTGTQEGVGVVTFAQVITMMSEHDASHAHELRALRVELGI